MADYPSNSSNNPKGDRSGASESAQTDETAENVGVYGRPASRQERAMKLDEALRNLNEALSHGIHLEDLFTKDYRFLKDAFFRLKPTLTQAVRETGRETRELLHKSSEETLNRGRELVVQARGELEKNPWAVIRSVAFGAVVLGFIVGAVATTASQKAVGERTVH